MGILQATIIDAEEILELQKLDYQVEAERYNNYNIPPLKQPIEGIKEQFKTHVFLRAVSEGRIIGTARGYEKTNKNR